MNMSINYRNQVSEVPLDERVNPSSIKEKNFKQVGLRELDESAIDIISLTSQISTERFAERPDIDSSGLKGKFVAQIFANETDEFEFTDEIESESNGHKPAYLEDGFESNVSENYSIQSQDLPESSKLITLNQQRFNIIEPNSHLSEHASKYSQIINDTASLAVLKNAMRHDTNGIYKFYAAETERNVQDLASQKGGFIEKKTKRDIEIQQMSILGPMAKRLQEKMEEEGRYEVSENHFKEISYHEVHKEIQANLEKYTGTELDGLAEGLDKAFVSYILPSIEESARRERKKSEKGDKSEGLTKPIVDLDAYVRNIQRYREAMAGACIFGNQRVSHKGNLSSASLLEQGLIAIFLRGVEESRKNEEIKSELDKKKEEIKKEDLSREILQTSFKVDSIKIFETKKSEEGELVESKERSKYEKTTVVDKGEQDSSYAEIQIIDITDQTRGGIYP